MKRNPKGGAPARRFPGRTAAALLIAALLGPMSLVMFTAPAAAAEAAETIVIAGDHWCPFNCEPDSDRPGYMIEVARRAFEPAGHEVRYKIIPWARAIVSARRGLINAIAGAYKEDAPDFIYPENALAHVGFSIFVDVKTEWTYQSIATLRFISLGVINDYAYSLDIDDYILENMHEPNRIQIASGETPLKTNIRKLVHGRIDALIETPAVFWLAASEMDLADGLKAAGEAVPPRAANIAFSPALPQSAVHGRILSEAVERMRESGELADLQKKYGLPDWRESLPYQTSDSNAGTSSAP